MTADLQLQAKRIKQISQSWAAQENKNKQNVLCNNTASAERALSKSYIIILRENDQQVEVLKELSYSKRKGFWNAEGIPRLTPARFFLDSNADNW